jgi:hypothetical protein
MAADSAPAPHRTRRSARRSPWILLCFQPLRFGNSAQFGIACKRNRCLRPVTTTHTALLRPATRPPRLGSRPRPGPGLSFGLIHPCPEPFTDVHPDRVCAVRERWRPPVNVGQHCWKACWGQPLASSNLASSATLTCDYALGSCSRAALYPKARVSFPVSVEPWPYASFRTHRCGSTLRLLTSYLVRTSRTYLNRTAHAFESCARKLPSCARTA